MLQVDKSPDLIYVKKSEYFDKINDFLGDNFERLEDYTGVHLNKDLESYRQLIQKTFGKSLPKNILEDMHPPSSISDFYGQYKLHKDNIFMRGIVTSYNSIVYNSGTFIKELLAPIVSECNFSIDSLGDFKQKFILDKNKFNEAEHKIITADVINMYPNVNVPRTISYILDQIYLEPRKFFKYKNFNGIFLSPPTRANLKQFLLETLSKYSIFRSSTGVFKQKSGLAMGSSISSSISTIFVNLMEQNVVQSYVESGRLISY